MVATDIDHPSSRGSVSRRARDALAACVRAGVHVVFVTGRPPRWMPPVLDATGHAGMVICANGAIAIDTGRDRVPATHSLLPATVSQVVSRLRRRVPDMLFALETPQELRVEPGFHAARGPRRPEGLAPRATTQTLEATRIEQLVDDQPVIKLVAISAASRPDDLLALARETVGDLVAPTHSSPGVAMLELGPRGVSKASTLAALAASLGVRRSGVISFGDMPNDVEMLHRPPRAAPRGAGGVTGHLGARRLGRTSAAAPDVAGTDRRGCGHRVCVTGQRCSGRLPAPG
jgi:HAD superfamily hydrolase (TIGR01484 family)